MGHTDPHAPTIRGFCRHLDKGKAWKAAVVTRVRQQPGNEYCNTRRFGVGGFTNYSQPLQQVQRLAPTATTEHKCTNKAIGLRFIRNFNIDAVSYGACYVAIPRRWSYLIVCLFAGFVSASFEAASGFGDVFSPYFY
nr:hypothetical protein Iba_chr02cCG0550 [Ipomoea batatas]